jgi:hypothetical protein
MNITEEQLDRIEWALRIADFWLEEREPCDQLKLDSEDVQQAYEAIEQVKLWGNGTPLVECYAFGYYQGRASGVFEHAAYEIMSDGQQTAYKQGYDKGVCDHCDLVLDKEVTA